MLFEDQLRKIVEEQHEKTRVCQDPRCGHFDIEHVDFGGRQCKYPARLPDGVLIGVTCYCTKLILPQPNTARRYDQTFVRFP